MNWFRNLIKSYHKAQDSFSEAPEEGDYRFMNPEELDIDEFIAYQLEHKMLSTDSVVQEVVKRGIPQKQAEVKVSRVIERLRSSKRAKGILYVIIGLIMTLIAIFIIAYDFDFFLEYYLLWLLAFGLIFLCWGISSVYQARAKNYYDS